MTYLNKMINVVGIFLGEAVPAKPLKVSLTAPLVHGQACMHPA